MSKASYKMDICLKVKSRQCTVKGSKFILLKVASVGNLLKLVCFHRKHQKDVHGFEHCQTIRSDQVDFFFLILQKCTSIYSNLRNFSMFHKSQLQLKLFLVRVWRACSFKITVKVKGVFNLQFTKY